MQRVLENDNHLVMESEMMATTIAMMNATLNNDSLAYDVDDGLIIPLATAKLIVKIVNGVILMFLMISMGCAVDIKNIKETFRHPAGFFVGMLCQFILMPLIGFCLSLAFSLEPAGALSVLILACCPGGAISNLFTYATNGDVCLSVCMTTISTAVAIGMMPLNLFIYSRMWTSEKAVIPYVNIVTTLICILIPVAFGVFLRWWKKHWMKYVKRICIAISLLFIATALSLNLYINPTFLQAEWELWFCAATLPLLGYAMGYGLSFVLRQPHRKCRTIAFETGSQNVSLALTLTVITFGGSPLFLDMLFYPSLYACFVWIDTLLIILLFKVIVYVRNRRRGAVKLDNDDYYVVDENDFDHDDDEVGNNGETRCTENGHVDDVSADNSTVVIVDNHRVDLNTLPESGSLSGSHEVEDIPEKVPLKNTAV